MASPWLVPELSSWKGRGLTIPPDSLRAWIRLAVWQFWMGLVVGGAVIFGVQQITSAPDRIVTVEGLGRRVGGLNALFSVMIGLLLLVVAAWLLWELWMAVKPRPIADDFLKLLHDSFARDWRDPKTWPWARLAWAYGFALLGASLLAAVAFVLWSVAASRPIVKPVRARVHTSQTFKTQQTP
jgi:hypothetical protein